MSWTSSFRFTLASLAFASAVAASAAEPAPARYTFEGVLFPTPKSHPFGDAITWAKSPSGAQVEAALPSGSKNAGRTQWSCSIAQTGYLTDCKLEAEWPMYEGFADAAKELLPFFQVTSDLVQAAHDVGARADFQIDLGDDGRQVSKIPGECPVPFCSAVPPPPPPPKLPDGQLAQACRINLAASPSIAGEGVVIRLLDHDSAMALLAMTEANVGAPIDAAYLDNQRAIIQMANGTEATVLIPWGMQITTGERIAFQSGYRNTNLPCSYVPNLAIRKLP